MSELSSLLTATITLSWAAAVSPVTLSIFLILMSMTKNPKMAGVSFYLGAIVVLLITVFIGIFLGQKLTAGGVSDPGTMAAIDVFLGAVLFLLGLRNLVSKDESKSSRILKYLKIDPGSSSFSMFRRYFTVGVIAFLMNFSTAIFVLATGRVIGVTNAGFGPDALAIIVLIIIALLIIEIPLIFFLVLPKKAEKVTKPVNEWITEHGNILTGLFCIGIGLIVVLSGLQKIGLA
jgi:threonine/homoserine/homoserine lactone efflux protein